MKPQPTANASLSHTAQAAQQGNHSQVGEYARRDAACRVSTNTAQWQGRDVACDISTENSLIINNLKLIINTAAQHHSDACVAVTFGESFVSQRLAGAPARYTFSACRGMRRLDPKDTETGYGYFGARYYESGLSIWLSVDPLADKYPSLSSYVYCANNPVILVDPDGRDIWEFDQDGNFIGRTITNKVDQFTIVHKDKNGNKTTSNEKTLTFPHKTVTSHEMPTQSTEKYGIVTLDNFIFNNKDAARETFEFFANNTSVEWAIAEGLSQEGKTNYKVGTSHLQSNFIASLFLESFDKVLNFNHSHPHNNPYPSGADMLFSWDNPHIKQKIYTTIWEYSSFDKSGTTDSRIKNNGNYGDN